MLNLAGSWDRAEENERPIASAHEAWRDMKPFSTGGTCINFLTADEGPERNEAALDKALPRLAEVRRRWHPKNVFRTNRNIKPAERAARRTLQPVPHEADHRSDR